MYFKGFLMLKMLSTRIKWKMFNLCLEVQNNPAAL